MLRVLLATVLLLAAALGWSLWRAEIHKGAAAEAEQRALAAAAVADATAGVRVIERQRETDMAAVAAAYERGKSDAQDEADRALDDLRAGNRRLRDHWRGCLATADLSRAAGAAAEPDGAAELRRTGAADLVRVGAACDAHVTALQDALRVLGVEVTPR